MAYMWHTYHYISIYIIKVLHHFHILLVKLCVCICACIYARVHGMWACAYVHIRVYVFVGGWRGRRERDAHRDTSREMLTLDTNSDWVQNNRIHEITNNRIHEYSQVSAWFTQKPNKDLRSTDYFSTGYYHIQ